MEDGGELPYPKAKRLREAGQTDGQIIDELMRDGQSAEDARFTLSSLPGGALDTGARPLDSDVAASGGSGGLPLTGILMLIGGIAITAVSYSAAAPGGTYIVTWGLIAAGLMRMMRGR